MQQVISSDQAKRITRGRMPLVPVEYETACRSLAECLTIDEARYWSDKADALAAWAKIYHSNETLRKAKQLKMHAFRRMGILAGEIKPRTSLGRHGNAPGPVSELMKTGLSKNSATASRRLASMTQKDFDKMLEKPKAPSSIVQDLWLGNEDWAAFVKTAMSFRAALKRATPESVAAACKQSQRHTETARGLITDISDWLDELDRRLPKEL